MTLEDDIGNQTHLVSSVKVESPKSKARSFGYHMKVKSVKIERAKSTDFPHQVRSQGSLDQICNSLKRTITHTDDLVMLVCQLIVTLERKSLPVGKPNCPSESRMTSIERLMASIAIANLTEDL